MLRSLFGKAPTRDEIERDVTQQIESLARSGNHPPPAGWTLAGAMQGEVVTEPRRDSPAPPVVAVDGDLPQIFAPATPSAKPVPARKRPATKPTAARTRATAKPATAARTRATTKPAAKPTTTRRPAAARAAAPKATAPKTTARRATTSKPAARRG